MLRNRAMLELMPALGLALDIPALDELFILKAMLQRGLEPVLLQPYSAGSDFSEFQGLEAVINRLQHRYRRLRVAEYVSSSRARCLNPFGVEYLCRSKLTMKQAFERTGLMTAPWLLTDYPLGVPGNDSSFLDPGQAERVGRWIDQTLGYPVVVKAAEGSRGSAILLIRDKDEFIRMMESYAKGPPAEIPVALYPNMTSPEGMFVERYLSHPFDIRALVASRHGILEYWGSLVRVGLDERRLSKSTVGEFVPVEMEGQEALKDLALRSGEALAASAEVLTGKRTESWVVGLDIIVSSRGWSQDRRIYEAVRRTFAEWETTEAAMIEVDRAQEVSLRKHGVDLEAVLEDRVLWDAVQGMDDAFGRFRSTEAYASLRGKVKDHLQEAEFFVTEANSRIDFARMTRTFCLPDLAERIVNLALD